MAQITAQKMYECEVERFQKYYEENTYFDIQIIEEKFPYTIIFTSDRQITMLDQDTGEINEQTITIQVGLKTTAKIETSSKIDAKFLKTLIKKSEKLGQLYYLQFREIFGTEQGE